MNGDHLELQTATPISAIMLPEETCTLNPKQSLLTMLSPELRLPLSKLVFYSQNRVLSVLTFVHLRSTREVARPQTLPKFSALESSQAFSLAWGLLYGLLREFRL